MQPLDALRGICPREARTGRDDMNYVIKIPPASRAPPRLVQPNRRSEGETEPIVESIVRKNTMTQNVATDQALE